MSKQILQEIREIAQRNYKPERTTAQPATTENASSSYQERLQEIQERLERELRIRVDRAVARFDDELSALAPRKEARPHLDLRETQEIQFKEKLLPSAVAQDKSTSSRQAVLERSMERVEEQLQKLTQQIARQRELAAENPVQAAPTDDAQQPSEFLDAILQKLGTLEESSRRVEDSLDGTLELENDANFQKALAELVSEQLQEALAAASESGEGGAPASSESDSGNASELVDSLRAQLSEQWEAHVAAQAQGNEDLQSSILEQLQSMRDFLSSELQAGAGAPVAETSEETSAGSSVDHADVSSILEQLGELRELVGQQVEAETGGSASHSETLAEEIAGLRDFFSEQLQGLTNTSNSDATAAAEPSNLVEEIAGLREFFREQIQTLAEGTSSDNTEVGGDSGQSAELLQEITALREAMAQQQPLGEAPEGSSAAVLEAVSDLRDFFQEQLQTLGSNDSPSAAAEGGDNEQHAKILEEITALRETVTQQSPPGEAGSPDESSDAILESISGLRDLFQEQIQSLAVTASESDSEVTSDGAQSAEILQQLSALREEVAQQSSQETEDSGNSSEAVLGAISELRESLEQQIQSLNAAQDSEPEQSDETAANLLAEITGLRDTVNEYAQQQSASEQEAKSTLQQEVSGLREFVQDQIQPLTEAQDQSGESDEAAALLREVTELKGAVQDQFTQAANQDEQAQSALLERIDKLEQTWEARWESLSSTSAEGQSEGAGAEKLGEIQEKQEKLEELVGILRKDFSLLVMTLNSHMEEARTRDEEVHSAMRSAVTELARLSPATLARRLTDAPEAQHSEAAGTSEPEQANSEQPEASPSKPTPEITLE